MEDRPAKKIAGRPSKKMEDKSVKVSSYPADPIENMRIMIYDR